MSAKNLPSTQSEQEVDDGASLYLPDVQMGHASTSIPLAALTRKVPLGQPVHEVDPEPANVPEGHPVQASSSIPVAGLVR
jgi:hypothetical protein